jgi:hypothetical protein
MAFQCDCGHSWETRRSKEQFWGEKPACPGCRDAIAGNCVICGQPSRVANSTMINKAVFCTPCLDIPEPAWCPRCGTNVLYRGYLKGAFHGDRPGLHAAALVPPVDEPCKQLDSNAPTCRPITIAHGCKLSKRHSNSPQQPKSTTASFASVCVPHSRAKIFALPRKSTLTSGPSARRVRNRIGELGGAVISCHSLARMPKKPPTIAPGASSTSKRG